MRKFLLAICGMVLFILPAFAVTVNVTNPLPYATVTSPVTFKARAGSSKSITAWHIYVDNKDAYGGSLASSAISPSLALSAGNHNVVVRAWDASGANGTSSFQIKVSTTAVSSGPVAVTVASPLAGATVSSPATVHASATSAKAITGWRVYVDGKDSYGGPMSTASISPSLTLAAGTHTLMVRAWDASGAYGTNTVHVTVRGSAPPPPPPPTSPSEGPVAPATAKVFPKIENMAGWGACAYAACSGNDGGVYWMAQNVTTPSLDGASTEFYAGGRAYSDILRWKNLGRDFGTKKFIYEVWFYIDNPTAAGALEFDYLQVLNGKKYNFSSQCDYFYGSVWDVWNGVTKRWIHTNMACPKFTANTWHHYKMYGEIVPTTGQTHYFNIWIDGKDNIPNSTYAYQQAENTSWPNNSTVQIQQDLSKTPGNGLHQWVDKVTLYLW
jgi:Bacterial Ig domain